MPNHIDPALLRRILAGESVDGFEAGVGNYTGPAASESFDMTGDPRFYEQAIYRNLANPSGFGTNKWETYNTDGSFRGYGSGDSDATGWAKFIAAALGGYAGAGALNGAFGGAAAGGTGAGGLTAADLGTAAWGELGAGAATGAGAAGAGGMSGWDAAMLDAGAGATNVGAGAAGAGGMTGSQVLDAMGGAKTLAGVAGAIAGAVDSGDKTQTTSRDPWGPAQPLLKDLVTQGQTLQQQYQTSPFSPTQQTAYNNFGGLLNAINGGAPGLLAGFGANASGANNYDRSNPRRPLQGSSFNFGGWQPGLLNFFPQGGK